MDQALPVGLSRVDTANVVVAQLTLGYACPRQKCDFKPVLEEMASSIELRRWGVGKWCAASTPTSLSTASRGSTAS